jgi:benzodiazapine receptor
MLILLVSLLVIYLRLGYGVQTVPAAERWLVQLPFSIYLGWVSVATIANATSLLDFLGWNGWGIPATYWAIIMLFAGTVIAFAMVLTRRDVAYTLVFIWAFAGIAVRQAAVPLVATAAWVLAGVIAVLTLWTALRKR